MSGARRQRVAALISELKTRQIGHGGDPQASTGPRDAVSSFDFSKLPELDAYRTMAKAAERFGFASPYFRMHDGPPSSVQRIGEKERINFASYDYLGLNGDPRINEAAIRAIDDSGISPGASRLVGGERDCHRVLEQALAELHGVADAVVMVSGHATNVSVLRTLLGPEDLVVTDALAHNSLIEGARLSGATRLTCPHNDYDWLDRELGRIRGRHRRVVIAVESLYSMDGDSPDLASLVSIKARHGAWLMVDEAHGVGVLGQTGRGIAEEQGVDPLSVEIWMGTLSKTLGSCGGYIAGSADLIRLMKYKAPGFVFSVGLPPVLAVAACEALRLMLEEPERVDRLAQNGAIFYQACRSEGLDTGRSKGRAITSILTGDSMSAVALSQGLFDAGINALPVVYPAVPERQARVRFFITARHTEDQLVETVSKISECRERLDRMRPIIHEELSRMAAEKAVYSSGSISARNP